MNYSPFHWISFAVLAVRAAYLPSCHAADSAAGLPLPPMSAQPWAPPETSLPPALVAATTKLFEQGLADPRGCEYREVEVMTGRCWGSHAAAKIHGWLLPESGPGPRFAVGWNGLVYPVLNIGAPANLRDDIVQAIKMDREIVAKHNRDNPGSAYSRWWRATPEAASLSHQAVQPLMACLLLRLGEENAARELWNAWSAAVPAGDENQPQSLVYPYLILSTDWLWSMFDRAVCAHMRGDDRLALAELRRLASIQPSVVAEAGLIWRGRKEDTLMFDWLKPLPELLADQERRAREPSPAPPVADAPQAERISAAIRALDQVAARQWGQPGGISFGGQEIQALVSEGEAAIEPLLACLESDKRLTRSVSFHRDFSHHRNLHGVSDAAVAALEGILQTSLNAMGVTSQEQRKAAAERIRAYWKKNQGLSQEERWFRTLADDQASPGDWRAAAEVITRSGRAYTWGAGFHSAPLPGAPAKPGEPIPMRGEALRTREKPSVSDLMVRRITQCLAPDKPDDGQQRIAAQLTVALAAWDGRARSRELRTLTSSLRERSSWPNDLYAVFRARQAAGDLQVLKEYAAWITTLTPQTPNAHSIDSLFTIMWQHPDDPDMLAAAESIFNDAASPWAERFLCHSELSRLFYTPIIGMEPVRRRLLAELAVQARAGAGRVREGGDFSFTLDESFSTSTTCTNDPMAPAAGTEVVFRKCDYYAWSLSQVVGWPRCELYWPEERRNEAVAACAAFLRRFGERYAYQAPPAGRMQADSTFPGSAQFHLPPLPEPATLEQELAGTAIFSLAGKGETRVLPLPALPQNAARLVSGRPRGFDAAVKSTEPDGRFREPGKVWQAEEVLTDGKWQRWFGFAGGNSVVRVAAEDILFPGGQGWSELSGGTDCRLAGPWHEPVDGRYTPLLVSDPLRIRISLRNRTGLDQAPPQALGETAPSGQKLLAPGLSLRLWRAEPGQAANELMNQVRTSPSGSPEPDPWKEIPTRDISRMTAFSPGKPLAPAEERQVHEIDLHDWFPITLPGDYRFQLIFDDQRGAFAQGTSAEVSFSLSAPESSGPSPAGGDDSPPKK